MWPLTLLAADDPLSRSEVIYGAAGLAAALAVGAVAIALADRWRKRAAAAPPADAADTLASYRDMHEQGELTDAEFTELRRKLAEKKAAPAATAAPAADTTGRPNLAKFVPPDVLAKRQPPAAPADLPEPPAPPETS